MANELQKTKSRIKVPEAPHPTVRGVKKTEEKLVIKTPIIPVSFYTNTLGEDGFIWSYMFPERGAITDMQLHMVGKDLKTAQMTIDAVRGNEGVQMNLLVRGGYHKLSEVRYVEPGDRIKIFLKNFQYRTRDGGTLDEVWFAFNYRIDPEVLRVDSFNYGEDQ